MFQQKVFFSFILSAFLSQTSFAANSLFNVYEQAKLSDPSFKIADVERQVAAAEQQQAQSRLLPTANATANLNKSWDRDFNETDETASYSLNLNYALYNQTNNIGLIQANRQIEKRDSEYVLAEQALLIRVAQAYFNVLSSVDNVTFSKAFTKASNKQLEQSQQRYDVGLIAITDVQESQAGYDSAIASGIRAQSALNNSYEALREVTGEQYTALSSLKEALPLVTPVPEDIEKWVEIALNTNPSLQASKYDVEIARADINLRRAAYQPQVNLTASHGYRHSERPLFNANHGFDNNIAANVVVPIDINGGIRAGVARSRARYTQALDGLERNRRSIQTAVRSAYLNVLFGISNVKALKQAVLSNQTAFKATVRGFEVGTRTTVEVLNSQQQLLQTQRDYARARYDYVLNTLILKQAAGLLTEGDLKKLNDWFV